MILLKLFKIVTSHLSTSLSCCKIENVRNEENKLRNLEEKLPPYVIFLIAIFTRNIKLNQICFVICIKYKARVIGSVVLHCTSILPSPSPSSKSHQNPQLSQMFNLNTGMCLSLLIASLTRFNIQVQR